MKQTKMCIMARGTIRSHLIILIFKCMDKEKNHSVIRISIHLNLNTLICMDIQKYEQVKSVFCIYIINNIWSYLDKWYSNNLYTDSQTGRQMDRHY